MPNYIAFAIPFFVLLIGLEVLVAWKKKRSVYRFNDAVVDLSAGITQQVCLIFMKGGLIFTYAWAYEHHRLATLSSKSVWVWIAAFVVVDLIYYWWHRLSHEVNFLWAAHVVHHQSEDYNLAVALRQSVVTLWTSFPFHLSLAFIGVSPLVFVAADSFNTLYQFWIHTELVGKLGWFEKVFNTPSHHRVHHGINPRYLDKNYAGILIFWDRLFGTLEIEGEPPVYGLVKPLASFNPLWAQLHYWRDLAKIALAAPRPLDKLKIWLKPPPWLPRGLTPYPPAPEVSPATYVKYDPQIPFAQQLYVFVNLVVVVAGATVLLFNEDRLPSGPLRFAAGLVLATVLIWGGMFERRSWALPAELLRLAAMVFGAAWAARLLDLSMATMVGVAAVIALALAAWILRARASSGEVAPGPAT